MGKSTTPARRPRFERLELRLLLALFGPAVSYGFGGASAHAPANNVLLPLPNGKIFTVGTHVIPPDPEIFDDIATYETWISRVNADGTIDTTFGDGGNIDLGETEGVAFNGSRLY